MASAINPVFITLDLMLYLVRVPLHPPVYLHHMDESLGHQGGGFGGFCVESESNS